jgi:hypothetical protein
VPWHQAHCESKICLPAAVSVGGASAGRVCAIAAVLNALAHSSRHNRMRGLYRAQQRDHLWIVGGRNGSKIEDQPIALDARDDRR